MRIRDYHVSAALAVGNLVAGVLTLNGWLAGLDFFLSGFLLVVALDEWSCRRRANVTIPAWNANPDGTVTGYMCMVDWECEIGGACRGNTVFPSADDLRENKGCATGCGIVEVSVSFKRLVQAGTDRP